ncbi:hypothetical protein OXX79_012003, partial [Metschnikowia pulcherrima]
MPFMIQLERFLELLTLFNTTLTKPNRYNFPWLYQYGWDSVISAIPQWTSLSISTGGYILDPAQPSEIWGGVTNYVQNLSLENGVVSTSYTWLGKLHLQYDILANK